MRPSEAFLTPYLTGPDKNLTLEEVIILLSNNSMLKALALTYVSITEGEMKCSIIQVLFYLETHI